MKKFEAFIFDMDGVIIDSEPVHDKIVRKILARDNIFVSDEEFSKFMGMASTEVFQIFIDKYRLPHTAQEMSEEQMMLLKEYIKEQRMEPIAGIRELLRSLKEHNVPAAIASSSPMHVIEFVAASFGIKDCFEFFISGEDLKRSKPAPDIYLKAAEKLNVRPENCVVLEDSENGVKAAKAAGMYCIAYDNPNSGRQDLSAADMIAAEISDIELFAD